MGKDEKKGWVTACLVLTKTEGDVKEHCDLKEVEFSKDELFTVLQAPAELRLGPGQGYNCYDEDDEEIECCY